MCGSKTRPHANVIHAWANGADVQYKVVDSDFGWIDTAQPTFFPSWSWRIKPVILRYRIARMKNIFSCAEYHVLATNTEEQEKVQKNLSFVKWVSDWTEVEEL